MRTRHGQFRRFIRRTHTAVFIVRFCLCVFIAFLGIGFVLYSLVNRHSGSNYFEHIATLSDLQQRLPVIIIVTAVTQAVIVSGVLFLLALFWAHAVAGPLFRVERLIETLIDGETGEDIVFRRGDQLHSLAGVLRDFQHVLRSRRADMSRGLAEAEGLWGMKDAGKQRASLKNIYIRLRQAISRKE